MINLNVNNLITNKTPKNTYIKDKELPKKACLPLKNLAFTGKPVMSDPKWFHEFVKPLQYLLK